MGKPNGFQILGKRIPRKALEQTAQMRFADKKRICDRLQRQFAFRKMLGHVLQRSRDKPPFSGREFGNVLDRTVDVTAYRDQKQGKMCTHALLPILPLSLGLLPDRGVKGADILLRSGVEHGVCGPCVFPKDPEAEARMPRIGDLAGKPIPHVEEQPADRERVSLLGAEIAVRNIGADGVYIPFLAGNDLIGDLMQPVSRFHEANLNNVVRTEKRNGQIRVVDAIADQPIARNALCGKKLFDRLHRISSVSYVRPLRSSVFASV